MILIDKTYFKSGLTKIANLNTTSVESEGRATDINDFIETYEPEFLNELLGYDFYEEFINGLSQSVVDQKWTDLKAQIVDTSSKKSVIANYVWFRYWQQIQQTSTETGDKQITGGNLTAYTNLNKACQVWNVMADSCIKMGIYSRYVSQLSFIHSLILLQDSAITFHTWQALFKLV